ncbi:MFS transporter [Saccharothrix coeruleofusca]|uniref:MFS family arabinose efflux permease n=1 Tax=Saccharothrix coeruleofusca TaxID=33919 RepID=A0A918AW80_9PSEU|nr:MFS transporter [Saccharothrix coeruleofusca]GGP79307.1 hypothetical protein GCM10010185_61470 [Saccharothrix coeruleofusca]
MAVVSLRHNHVYQRLWISHTLSLIGTLASFVSLPLLILDSFHSPAAVGLVSFVGAATLLLVMPWTGLLVDRTGWRAVMVACDLLRATALALLAAAIAGDRVTFALVLAVTVVNSALSVPFLSATGAALRASVEAGQLPAALALNQGRTAVVGILGPVGGAALYDDSTALPFAVDALSFLLSALCVCTLRTRARTPAGKPGFGWRDLGAGWRFLRGHPFLRYMALNICVTDFSFNGLVLVLVVTSSAEGNAMGAGVIMAASGAGNALGSALAVPVMRWARSREPVVLSVWTTAATAAAVAAQAGMPWSALLLGIACLAASIVAVITNTTILRETPAHLLGRVQTIFQTAPRLVAAGGSSCAGVLLTFLPVQVVLPAFAVPLAALALHTTSTRALRAVHE